MPRGDRTGPDGIGPMTGRGAGYCAGSSTPGYLNPMPRRGLGRGFGRGMGRGRGFGFRRFQFAQPENITPVYREPTKEQEVQYLEQESKSLEQEQKIINKEMEEIKKRLDELKENNK